jgi:hypothetical protein
MPRCASKVVDVEVFNRGEVVEVGIEELTHAFGIVMRDMFGRIDLDGLTRPAR